MERLPQTKDSLTLMRQSKVYQLALSMAKGKYFVLLDGDDYYCNDSKFADGISFLESNPRYVSYMTGYKIVYTDGTEKEFMPKHYPEHLFWATQYVHVSGCIFRRKVFDDGYILNRFCSDQAVTFSILCAGKMYFSDVVTFAYRQRAESIVHSTPRVEYEIRHVAFLQDCLCSGRMKFGSYCKFGYAINVVYQNREALHDDTYAKYMRDCEKYSNNILKIIADADKSLMNKITMRYIRLKAKFLWLFFMKSLKPYRWYRALCKKILSR